MSSESEAKQWVSHNSYAQKDGSGRCKGRERERAGPDGVYPRRRLCILCSLAGPAGVAGHGLSGTLLPHRASRAATSREAEAAAEPERQAARSLRVGA